MPTWTKPSRNSAAILSKVPPTLLQRHQIDDEAWNALIDKARHPAIYAYTWYLDCVSPDWQALVWPSAQNFEIVMPLPVKKRLGWTVVQQPLFCQYLGLFSREEISEESLSVFLESLSRHFAYISAYDFLPSHTPLLRKLLPTLPEFETNEKTTHWLNLEDSYSEIVGHFNVDRRKNFKKTRKYNWEWFESTDVEPIILLFRENHAFKIQNVKESAYVQLRNLTKIVLEKSAGRLIYASLRGEIHAGIMILEKNDTGIYIFNAADAVGRKGNARTFLLDQYFRGAAGRLKIFDFESPEVESISAFYKSFGAERQVFISIRKNRLPFPLRQLQEFRKWTAVIAGHS